MKLRKWLLWIGLVCCLVQIWAPSYFLTGDGPCHMYNSYVLKYKVTHPHNHFYDNCYEVLDWKTPNWLGHLCFAALLLVFKINIAEKIGLSFYMLVFVFGFLYLERKLTEGRHSSALWPVVAFIFVFTHPLIKGFYNFETSVAFLFWSIWAWLCFLEKKSIKTYSVCLFFTACSFFSHMLGFFYSLFITACLILPWIPLLNRATAKQNTWRHFFVIVVAWLTIHLPLSYLFKLYYTENGAPFHLKYNAGNLHSSLTLDSLVNRTHAEQPIAVVCATLFLLMLVVGLAYTVANMRSSAQSLSLFFSLIIAAIIYVFFPDWLSGGGAFSMRAQLLFYIVTCIFIASVSMPTTIKNVSAAILFTLFIVLSIIRLPGIVATGKAADDIMTAGKYIKPYSNVLQLSFSHDGKDEKGNVINNSNWVFQFAAQYINDNPPLVMLNNYEANTWYFPLAWKSKVNPFHFLNKEESMIGQPPYVGITDYEQRTQVTVDYIIFWCYEDKYLNTGHVRQLMGQVNSNYHIRYTSPSRRTVLYERNSIQP